MRHEHGALAAIEIMHHGASVANWGTRLAPIGPSHRPIIYHSPVQARAVDKEDISNLRHWHRDAALRSKRAGFDIVYVYATHDLSIAHQFLQRRKNDRSDEYGGSLENRARLLRELIEDTKEAVGDTCAVAVRFAADELIGDAGLSCEGEARDVVEMLAELPDLWDINISNWPNDSQTSRFAKEGFQEPYTSWVKQVTSKPVVGVGRFTSPDTMVSQIRRGVMDFIGAARPSIADPFLPRKIEEGRIDEIRECIGCNMCVSSDYTSTNLRCTQNPTMGEEWRRGWHPEIIPQRKSEGTVLVVGAGPAGLKPHWQQRAAAMRCIWPKRARTWVSASAARASFRGLPSGRAFATGASVSSNGCRTSPSIAAASLKQTSSSNSGHAMSPLRRDRPGGATAWAAKRRRNSGFERPALFTPANLEGPCRWRAGRIWDETLLHGRRAEDVSTSGLDVTMVTTARWFRRDGNTLSAEHRKRLPASIMLCRTRCTGIRCGM